MKKSLIYSTAAIALALVIIGTSLYANSNWMPKPVQGQTNFLVMLTDPPNVPKGTTKLGITYSNIQLHVVASDGTANWVAAQESGSVDLLSLVDVKQTIASLSLQTGSTVDKLQFTISSAKATIDGVEVPVTILSDQMVVTLRGTKLTGTTTGALIDLRPTLMKINASDVNGNKLSYYVLVPSATAIIKSSVEEGNKKVGTKSHLDDDENEELDEEYQKSKGSVVITGADLSVEGEKTTISVTIKNNGDSSVKINGIQIRGDFKTNPKTNLGVEEGNDDHDENDSRDDIIFKISGDKLVPVLGDNKNGDFDHSGSEIKAGESLTLTFSGVIKMANDHDVANQITISPIKDNVYSIKPLNKDSVLYEVTSS